MDRAALATRDRLSARGLAETLMGGGELARFTGDLSRAIELKEELAAVGSDELQRPNWKAATLADLCEIALDQGDFAGARSYAEQSAAAGGGARVALCFAELALREGDLRSAETNGVAALADLEEGAFNHATCLELLGETARRSGNDALADDRFRDAIQSFAELSDGGGVADCLDGLARLAAAVGESERAGRLRGAAERLRETRGRREIRADLPSPQVPGAPRKEGGARTGGRARDTPLHPPTVTPAPYKRLSSRPIVPAGPESEDAHVQVSDDPRVGTELAGYRIESLLGLGGMSVVYLAEDLRLKRRLRSSCWLPASPRTSRSVTASCASRSWPRRSTIRTSSRSTRPGRPRTSSSSPCATWRGVT